MYYEIIFIIILIFFVFIGQLNQIKVKSNVDVCSILDSI